MYAFIDESGDTGKSKKSSKNFVIVAIVVESNVKLERLAKKVYKTKVLNKHKFNQLHAAKDTEKVRDAIINNLNKIEYSVFYTNNKDYFKSLVKVLNKIKDFDVKEVHLASRNTKDFSKKKILETALDLDIKIIISSPPNDKGLQIADFISWSIFRSLEHKDGKYIKEIKNVTYIK